MKAFLFFLGLAYVLLPWDLLPDMALPWGLLDDAVIAGLLWNFYRAWLLKKTARPRPSEGPGADRKQARADTGPSPSQSPHEVLGVSSSATQKEIREAYRKLAAKYHPDKVEHLGEEFRVLAERRFKEIQAAYRHLSRGA